MSGDRFIRHIRMFWRAETIIADIRMRRAIRSLLAIGAALVLTFLAMIALSIAAYMALEPFWGPVWAAATIGGAHLWFAAVALLIAFKPRRSREAELAEEVRNETLQVLSEEIQVIRDDVVAVGRILRHPFDGALLSLLTPLVGIILKSFQKTDTDASAE